MALTWPSLKNLAMGDSKPGVGHLDPGQSFCAEDLCFVREVVHLLAGQAGHARRGKPLHLAAQFHGLEEDLEVGGFRDIRDILQFQPETGVRLVRAVAVHGFLVGKPREGPLQIDALDRLEDLGQEAPP